MEKLTLSEAKEAHRKWINIMEDGDTNNIIDKNNFFKIDIATANSIKTTCTNQIDQFSGKPADLHVYFGIHNNKFIAFLTNSSLDAILRNENAKTFNCFNMEAGDVISLDKALLNNAKTRVARWQQAYKEWLREHHIYCLSFKFASFEKIVKLEPDDVYFYLGITQKTNGFNVPFEVELLLTNEKITSEANFTAIDDSLPGFDFSSTDNFAIVNISTPVPPYPDQFKFNEEALLTN